MYQGLQAGFLLHHQNYQESSLLIDVLTQTLGRISLIAKGVRRQKSHYLGLLRPFIPLNITYIGSGQLKTLRHVETCQSDAMPPGLNTYCGFYLNELLHHFMPLGDPCPDVFLYYLSCLQQLKSNQNISVALRTFEIQLLQALGYGLQLKYDYLTHNAIEATDRYQYDIQQGATINAKGHILGATLIAMQQADYKNTRQLNEAKRLMRQIIDFYLQGKPLKSRTLATQLI